MQRPSWNMSDMNSPFGSPMTGGSAVNLEDLFYVCDVNGNGVIERHEFRQLCSDIDLSDSEFDEVFGELDKDGDGKINKSDFERSFASVQALFRQTHRRRRSSVHAHYASRENLFLNSRQAWEEYKKGDLGNDFQIISEKCQEQVCDLYQLLHQSDMPHLVALFENVILAVVRDIKTHQNESQRVESSYKREKDLHSMHMRQMEEEMEAQVQRMEIRVRHEEREHAEAAREELRRQLENEIHDLSSNLKRLQSMDTEEQSPPRPPSIDLKSRNDELVHESRQMRSQLTDAQTNLALTKSELTSLKQHYDEKSHELESERATLVEYIKEQDNLTRQVHLLIDANKKLHDANDDLRAELENARTTNKRPYQPGRARMRSAEILRQYFMESSPIATISRNSSLAEEFSLTGADPFRRHLLPAQESCEEDSIQGDGKSSYQQLYQPLYQPYQVVDTPFTISTPYDSHRHSRLSRLSSEDSGRSTLRSELRDFDSEYDPNSLVDDDATSIASSRKRQRRSNNVDDSMSEAMESGEEMDLGPDEDEVDGFHLQRPNSVTSESSSHRARVRRNMSNIPQHISGEPERMYKVVLAGDAAVGKSSFIMRLCKNKFVGNLHSTLGVDFQTKIIQVDGRIIALQLWDTAGQERFRSIAKSYFRRADGVLLLYDTTYERSFVNVRDWIECIEESSTQKVPIMMCGNKTDLRDEMERSGDGRTLVKREDGQKLAKQFEALFIETSAKDGSNIYEACIELARMLRTNEDLEVQTVGMTLNDLKAAEKSKKLGNCC